MKKITYVFFSACLLILCFSIPVKAEKTDNGLQYEISEDGTASIISYLGSEKDIVIPYEFNGNKVVDIQEAAFMGCTFIESVRAPWVSSVGEGAFEGCKNLRDVNLQSTEKLGKSAFYDCEKLEKIEISNISKIEDNTFTNCSSLKEVNLLFVTSIGEWSFAFCSNLQTIDMPFVKEIGQSAFCYCDLLSNVNLSRVELIENDAFVGCDSLINIEFPSVTRIEDNVFELCTNLEDIYMPSIGYLGNNVFLDCENFSMNCNNKDFLLQYASVNNIPLKHINIMREQPIKETCTNSGKTEGSHCAICGAVIKKQDVIPPKGHTLKWVVDKKPTITSTGIKHQVCIICGSLQSRNTKIDKLPIIKGKTYTIGTIKYKITNAATNGNGTATIIGTTKKKTDRKYTSLYVRDTVKIGGKSFKITGIGDRAFKGYKKLKKVTLGNKIVTLGKECFADCSSLKSVTLGSNITKIADRAFYKDKNLRTFIIKSKRLKTVGKNTITNCNKKLIIKVPVSKLKTYKKLFKSKTGYVKTMQIKRI